ncbi:hypothetical protein ACFVXC_10890 [Streptomyces sp. NPDC058257]|uniref:hypothetical protein n=1 Tax=Streptomyces sp. NPDC058257 TaxID=3346409 RepID=UPI0036E68E48
MGHVISRTLPMTTATSELIVPTVRVSGGREGAIVLKDRVLRVWVDWTVTVASRVRGRERDAGAGFVEYAGLMILIAGIFTLIDQIGLDGMISGAIRDAVTDVTGG